MKKNRAYKTAENANDVVSKHMGSFCWYFFRMKYSSCFAKLERRLKKKKRENYSRFFLLIDKKWLFPFTCIRPSRVYIVTAILKVKLFTLDYTTMRYNVVNFSRLFCRIQVCKTVCLSFFLCFIFFVVPVSLPFDGKLKVENFFFLFETKKPSQVSQLARI